MKRRILGVDVDLTVCPSDVKWAEYLKLKTFEHFNGSCPVGSIVTAQSGKIPYNLAELFPHVEDPFEYWRTLEYSQFEPLPGAVEKLEELNQYFDIAFISATKGKHAKEKYYWCQEHFPFMVGFMATKEKWLMNDSVVAMADDRLENLCPFDYNKRVLFETPYAQTVDCPVAYRINGWESFSVADFCKQYLK